MGTTGETEEESLIRSGKQKHLIRGATQKMDPKLNLGKKNILRSLYQEIGLTAEMIVRYYKPGMIYSMSRLSLSFLNHGQYLGNFPLEHSDHSQ